MLATIEKHFLTGDTEAKKISSMLVYREENFKPLFAFESFLSESNSASCSDGGQSTCQPFLRWFEIQDKKLTEGGTVFFIEGKGYDGYFREPLKEIPFIFDSKNWALKRKYPPKPGEIF